MDLDLPTITLITEASKLIITIITKEFSELLVITMFSTTEETILMTLET